MLDMSEYKGRTAVITGAASGFVLFLASDACRCITGSNHVMDCGRLSLQPQ